MKAVEELELVRPQLEELDHTKSEEILGLSPVVSTGNVSGPLPLLVTTTFCELLVEPTSVGAKFKAGGSA